MWHWVALGFLGWTVIGVAAMVVGARLGRAGHNEDQKMNRH